MIRQRRSATRVASRQSSLVFTIGQCSLGAVLVAKTARGLCAVLFGAEHRGLVRELERRFPDERVTRADAELARLLLRVVALVERPGRSPKLRLDLRGTAFQQRVWQALRELPAGTTVSYSKLAQKIDAPKAARAVAQACACNSLAVVIPCHRVVRSDGSLGGYRWGVERKRALLERETGARE